MYKEDGTKKKAMTCSECQALVSEKLQGSIVIKLINFINIITFISSVKDKHKYRSGIAGMPLLPKT